MCKHSSAQALLTCWQGSFQKKLRFVITEKMGICRNADKKKTSYKNSSMVEKSADFPLHMFQKIEEVALKEKTTTADIIRRAVSHTSEFKPSLISYKNPLDKQEIHKGFTQKRKVIHFTPEQVIFLETTAKKNNLYLTEVIRACVLEYFK